jgi:hypothetical protein
MDKTLDIKRKKNIHLGLLIFFILLHLTHLVFYEMVKNGSWPVSDLVVKITIGFISVILTVLSIFFLRYFIPRKSLFYSYIVLFTICIVFQVSGLDIDIVKDKGTLSHMLLAWSMGISIFIVFSILYVSVKDIFTEKHDLTYALMGAANIFLCIILVFAFIIALVLLTNTGLMPGITTVNELNNISFIVSSYSVAGVDFPYNNIPQIVKNITTFQSIIMHLYAVMIVGRLLSR